MSIDTIVQSMPTRTATTAQRFGLIQQVIFSRRDVSVARDVLSKKLGDIVVEECDDGSVCADGHRPRTASCSRGRCF
jgi:hypothetical protein